MANSGQVRTQVGNSFFELNWQLAGQDVAGNFSRVNFQVVIRTNGMRYYSNAVKVIGGGINGVAVGTGTWSNITSDQQLLAGTIDIPHNSDGSKVFYADIAGWLYASGQNSAGVHFELPRIPRQSNPTFSKNLYTLGERIVVNMNRKAGFTHRGSVQIPDGNVIKEFRDQTDAWAWTPDESEIEEIYRRMPNTLKTSLGVDITTWNGGTQIGGVGWQNVEIQLDSSKILPEFSNFDFADSVASVTRITGNSKIFIQGFSKPRVEILPANKMIAKKFASPVKYVFSADGTSLERNFSENQSVSVIFERAISSSGSLAISASAVDSRGLSTTISKNVEVLPYSAPSLSVQAKRQNNFDETTEIDISGAISALKVGGTNKNAVLSIKMRHREVNGAWGVWKNLSAAMNDVSFSVSKQFLSLNRAESFEIEVLIADKLSETSQIVRVDSGKPIFFISSNKEKVGINKVPEFGDLDVAGEIYSQGKKVLTETPAPDGLRELKLFGVAKFQKTNVFYGEGASNTTRYIDWTDPFVSGGIGKPANFSHPEALGSNHAFVFDHDFDYVEISLAVRPYGSVDVVTFLRPQLNTGRPDRAAIRTYIDRNKNGGGSTFSHTGGFFNVKKGENVTCRVTFLNGGLIGETNQGTQMIIKCYKYV